MNPAASMLGVQTNYSWCTQSRLLMVVSPWASERVGKVLSVDFLNNKYHVVMLLISSTSPPTFIGRPMSRRCHWSRVHRSEVPFVAALDWDRVVRKDVYDYVIHVLLNIFTMRSIKYVDLIYLTHYFASHRLDLRSFLFVFEWNFVFYVTKPIKFLHASASENIDG
jgi:hypothetical protein